MSASGDDDRGNNAGAVYVFHHESGAWNRVAKLLPDAGSEVVGSCLAMHGNTIVAGGACRAYVFRNGPTGWVRDARLFPGVPADDDDFGASVAVWGDWIAVGDPVEYKPSPFRFGSVFLYRRSASGEWVLQQVIQSSDAYSDGQDNGKFGWSLDMHEDKLLVGSYRWGKPGPGGGPAYGRAYLFERDPSGAWIETRKLAGSDCPRGHLGWSVALTDDTALAGAEIALVNNVGAGAAYLYDLGLGERYGRAESNSTGDPARLTVSGSGWADNGRLALRATRVPTGRLGLFLASQSQDHVPYPGGSRGTLWLGAPYARFTSQLVVSDELGSFRIDVDTNAMPLGPPAPILPGDTWHFQAWFRDEDPGPTSNFTDAVRVTFQ